MNTTNLASPAPALINCRNGQLPIITEIQPISLCRENSKNAPEVQWTAQEVIPDFPTQHVILSKLQRHDI
jgi:hypothetical protein